MDLPHLFQPTPAGLAAASLAVIAGAPLFSDGLRALRLARGLRALRHGPLAEAPGGLGYVTGRVALESPMFAPLSGAPCAGFTLEVAGPRGRVAAPIRSFRRFHLVDGDAVARVEPGGATLALAATAERRLGPSDQPGSQLATLLGRVPEIAWMRSGGATLTMTERALSAGLAIHVVGTIRRNLRLDAEAELLARTGTDDAPVAAPPAAATAEPEAWIDAGDHLDFLHISDRAPDTAAFKVPSFRIAGAFVGPALSLGGLLLLADAADRFRALGGR